MNTADPNVVRGFSLAAALLRNANLSEIFPDTSTEDMDGLQRGVNHVLEHLNRFGWETIEAPPTGSLIPGRTVSRHALTRYREHFPHAENPDLLLDLAKSQEISETYARNLLGRIEENKNSEYLVNGTGQGVFIVVNNCVVTYVRLGRAQANLVRWTTGAAQ